MGIPSYYRFLCQKNSKIIEKTINKNNKTILCLDFNCIVYYCLSKMPAYNEAERFSYEAQLIQEVCKYVEYIWKQSGSADEVFIAVDGVVPMAKMKQQRLRRFKSIVLAEYEVQQQVRLPDVKSWDKNSITPGTLFMKKLDIALIKLCNNHKGWSVSGYNEPGEGEQKVMSHIRKYKSMNNTFIVYGLDADLILLCMLHSFNNTIYLLREQMEFNSVVKDLFNNEQFLYLNIDALKNSLFKNPNEQKILDYIMMMSLLGNDFLPHSLSLTIKDGGYMLLFNILKQFHTSNKYLVYSTGSICWKNLSDFIGEFYNQEELLIEEFCKKKKQMHTYKGRTEYEQKMTEVYMLPTKWFVEQKIYDGKLKEGWSEIYYKEFLQNKEIALKEYVKGIQWILDYYTGDNVDIDWYYPYMSVPLYKDLYKYLQTIIPGTIMDFEYNENIEPEQQLALVLPIESYNLVQNPKYKEFPKRFPHLYPTRFGFHSIGKKLFYECESNIPIFTTKLLREIL